MPDREKSWSEGECLDETCSSTPVSARASQVDDKVGRSRPFPHHVGQSTIRRIIPMTSVLVTGAGGFIGGHLVARLRKQGIQDIRGVDRAPLDEWHQRFDDVDSRTADLQELAACQSACDGVDVVYNLAADMGGMGFIENNKALCMLSVLISTHMLEAARQAGVQRFFYSSSACVYAAGKQESPEVDPLRESDAYPAMPEDGYGWEKLFSERMARHYYEDFGLETRVARYHNVYGPNGTYHGGREKAPAAICRKVAAAVLDGTEEIEIWGDGKQTRSFTYIDDCVEGTLRLTASDVREPLNVGSAELVTINDLVDIVEGIAGISLKRNYNLAAPQGVRGRNSDNARIEDRLGWAPSVSLHDGMLDTYRWIFHEMSQQARVPVG
jgi:GDP-D-mannose 3', 5'-epimerase